LAKGVVAVFLTVAVLVLCGRLMDDSSGPQEKSTGRDYASLERKLAYLNDIDEVSWVEFDANNVYVGFERRPADLSAIVNAAAVNGNRALGFGVHVWAVPGRRGWRPGDGTYYCEATARHGELEDRCN
jgi:hypothetical protein